MIPRLHVVSDDEVLADPRFPSVALAIARALGDHVALHLRGHGTPVRRLHALATGLEAGISGTGARLLVADRVDVALATGTAGVRLGAMSIPLAAARALLGPDRLLAASVHADDEAAAAARDGADFLILGTIWPTASHPGREGAGVGVITAVAERVDAPVVAIGGVTPQRVGEAMAAGAVGVAVLSGVWRAADPVAAAEAYIAGMPKAAGAAR